MIAHDFAAQRAETYASFADLDGAERLPEEADIDYIFLPGPGADWTAAIRALADEGYAAERHDPEPGDDDAADGPWLTATLTDQPVSALSVWLGEETATRIALAHGFVPDGWGFMG